MSDLDRYEELVKQHALSEKRLGCLLEDLAAIGYRQGVPNSPEEFTNLEELEGVYIRYLQQLFKDNQRMGIWIDD